MKGEYDDIIRLPHHISPARRRMSMTDRAAQFSPFAALTGHDAAIRETGRLTHQKIQLAEDSLEALDRTQRLLARSSENHPEISVTYFVPDQLKPGGEYITVSGNLKKQDPLEGVLVLTDGTRIPLRDILELRGDLPELSD